MSVLWFFMPLDTTNINIFYFFTFYKKNFLNIDKKTGESLPDSRLFPKFIANFVLTQDIAKRLLGYIFFMTSPFIAQISGQ